MILKNANVNFHLFSYSAPLGGHRQFPYFLSDRFGQLTCDQFNAMRKMSASLVFPQFHEVVSFMIYAFHPTTCFQSGVFAFELW